MNNLKKKNVLFRVFISLVILHLVLITTGDSSGLVYLKYLNRNVSLLLQTLFLVIILFLIIFEFIKLLSKIELKIYEPSQWKELKFKKELILDLMQLTFLIASFIIISLYDNFANIIVTTEIRFLYFYISLLSLIIIMNIIVFCLFASYINIIKRLQILNHNIEIVYNFSTLNIETMFFSVLYFNWSVYEKDFDHIISTYMVNKNKDIMIKIKEMKSSFLNKYKKNIDPPRNTHQI